MRIRRVAATAAFVLAATAVTVRLGSQQLPRDEFDPPLPTTTGAATPPTVEVSGIHSNRVVAKRELTDYGIGDPTHPLALEFSRSIAAEMSTLQPNSSALIVVTGSADGIPNPGIAIKVHELPAKCQRDVTLPIDDNELALLRGCIVREQIAASASSTKLPIVWDSRIHNEPDGGTVGGKFRAVWIEVHAQ